MSKLSLPELIESYLLFNITKKRAVRYIVADNMAGPRRGQGNKAAKREAKLLEARLAAAWSFEDSFNRGTKCGF
jgi:hypothetical protein